MSGPSISISACHALADVLRSMDKLVEAIENDPILLEEAGRILFDHYQYRFGTRREGNVRRQSESGNASNTACDQKNGKMSSSNEKEELQEEEEGPVCPHHSGGFSGIPKMLTEGHRDPTQGMSHPTALHVGAAPIPSPPGARCRRQAIEMKGFWISIWPCFGTHSTYSAKSYRAFVRSGFRHIVDITEPVAKALGCQPAPTMLFEPQGREVKSLQHLTSEGHYLLFPSGGFYRREAVPTALLKHLVHSTQKYIQAQ